MHLWGVFCFLGIGSLLKPFSFVPWFNAEIYSLVLLYVALFFIGSHIVGPNLLGKAAPCVLVNGGRKENGSFFLRFMPFAFGLLIHLYYFFSIDAIPLLHHDAGNFRVYAKKGYGSLILIGTSFFYLQMYLLARHYSIKRSLGAGVSLVCVGAFSVLTVLLVGFRSPAFFLVVYSVIVFYAFDNKFLYLKKLPKKVFILGVVILFAVMLVGVYRDNSSFTIGLSSVTWTFFVNLYNLSLIVSFFSDTGNLFYGSSFFYDLLVALPGFSSQFLGTQLADSFNLSFNGESISVTSIGEAYANFGFIGVPVYAFVLGVVSELIYAYGFSKNNFSRGIVCVFSVAFFRFASGGVSAIFFFLIAPTLLVFLLWRFLSLVRVYK